MKTIIEYLKENNPDKIAKNNFIIKMLLYIRLI